MPRRWLGARAAGGAKFKYHYSVLVDEVVLRAGVVAPPDASFRIAWKRGDKLATTRARAAEGGRIKFDETLALVCTMYRDTTGGGFDAKEATFTLLQQQGHKGETRKMARVSLDLSSYASVDPVVKDCGLVLLHDGVPVGDAKLTISCRWLRNYSRDRGDDAESMVSGTGSDRSDACSSYYGRGSGSGSSCASVGSSASSFSIAGASEAGSDVGKMSELDTDDELEEAGEAERSDGTAGVGLHAPAAAGRPREGGKAPLGERSFKAGSLLSRGPTKAQVAEMQATQAALDAAEARVAELTAALRSERKAGAEARRAAAAAAEKAGAELAALQSEGEAKAASLASLVEAERAAAQRAVAAMEEVEESSSARLKKAAANLADSRRVAQQQQQAADARTAELQAELQREAGAASAKAGEAEALLAKVAELGAELEAERRDMMLASAQIEASDERLALAEADLAQSRKEVERQAAALHEGSSAADELAALEVQLQAERRATKQASKTAQALSAKLSEAQAGLVESKSAAQRSGAASEGEVAKAREAAAAAEEARRRAEEERAAAQAELAAAREEVQSLTSELEAAREEGAAAAAAQEARAGRMAEEQTLAEERASTALQQMRSGIGKERRELEQQLADARAAGRDALSLVALHIARAERRASSLDLLQARAELAASTGQTGAGSAGTPSLAAALFGEGKAMNSGGDHWSACQLFEHAYVAQPRLAFLLSAANMRLKLHEPELAASLYRHVAEHADASDAEREMAARKLREAEAEGEALERKLSAALCEPVSLSEQVASVHDAAGSESDADSEDDDLFGGAELGLERRLCKQLVLMVGEGGGGVRRADEAADTAASQAACRQLEAQVAQLQQDLRKASVARAQALADKASVGRELSQLQKATRRARADHMALKEVATALEVKLAEQSTSAEARGELHRSGSGQMVVGDEMTRTILKQQAEQVVALEERVQELEAELEARGGPAAR